MERWMMMGKKFGGYVLAGAAALVIGLSVGPSQESLDQAVSEKAELKEELKEKQSAWKKEKETATETVEALETKVKELSAKVEEAKPWFELTAAEQASRQKEADLKEAELAEKEKKQEEAKAKEAAEKAAVEKKAEEEKAKAALAARTKTFSAGQYVVGRDIEPGMYDTLAVSGDGNFIVTSDYDLKVNEMFGTSGGFYNPAFKNLHLEEGDVIELNNNLKVKFTPLDK
ncbi:hypothetical protein ACFQPF_05470 [Fictibacillus iocasae]|uniref:Uncharacterized protein n=1 Tax=Fictibacillus iocasae TaxID=2715437 RepID=A0ABW2NKY9_9BACL